MSKKITKEYFKKCVGNDPKLDDLERCNCTDIGAPGHLQCGWNHDKNLPKFITG